VNDAPAGTDGMVAMPVEADYVFAVGDFGFTDPYDTPADHLSAVVITTLPGNGTLKLDNVAVTPNQSVPVADITAGQLTFTPDAGENGTPYATFAFQVVDDGGQANGGQDTDPSANTMTINVTDVNVEPTGEDFAVQALEDKDYVFAVSDFGFSDLNDISPDNLLNVIISTLPAAGVLRLNGTPVTRGQAVSAADIGFGQLTFITGPNGNGNAYATFTFQVQDDGGTIGGGQDTDQTPNTLTVHVTSVNDAPVGTNTTVTTPEDTDYTFTAANFGFTDPDDTPSNVLAAVVITTLPGNGNGTLKLNGGAVTPGQSVSVAAINAGQLTFTPAADANGTPYASFTFQVRDDGGTNLGGQDTDPSANTMTINVTAVNDAPAAQASAVTTNKNTAYTFAVGNFQFSDVESNALVSITVGAVSLASGDTLTVNLGAGPVAVTSGMTITAAQIATLKYTPSTGGTGAPRSTFTFTVNDANLGVLSATMNINVI
jgi:hypothetical protein